MTTMTDPSPRTQTRPTLMRPAPDVPRKVFITGANGFIGRALSQRLRELGSDVSGVDLVADETAAVLTGTTADPSTWSQALEGIDTVIHTAAVVSNVAPLDEAWEANVLGTRRVIEASARAGVRRFIHLSSIAAWGYDFPDGVDETYPVRVTGYSYVDTKVNGEAVVLAAHASGEIDCTIIRPGDVYGPGSRPWVLIPLDVIRSNQAFLPDGGRGIFSPVYIDNLVDGIVLAAAVPAAAGQVFTISDGIGVTCREYFERLAAMIGGSVRSLPTPAAALLARTTGAALRLIGRDSELSDASTGMLLRRGTYSIDKARSMLGYEPLVDLDEGMARVEAWARAEGIIAAP